MKTFVSTLLLICFYTVSFSQVQKASESYLIVRMKKNYDIFNGNKAFYYIAAEAGNNKASNIYNLLAYPTKRNENKPKAPFYSNRADTAQAFYNYFVSATEAINYLAEENWSLVAVYEEISSDYTNIQNPNGNGLIPVTTITTVPVYCFKRADNSSVQLKP